jgi:hypothetical protein
MIVELSEEEREFLEIICTRALLFSEMHIMRSGLETYQYLPKQNLLPIEENKDSTLTNKSESETEC